MLDPFAKKLVISVLGVGFLVVSKLVFKDGVEADATLGLAALMFGWAWARQPGTETKETQWQINPKKAKG